MGYKMIDEKQAQAIMNYKISRKDLLIKGGIIMFLLAILPKQVSADWLFRRGTGEIFSIDEIAMQYVTVGTDTLVATSGNTDTLVITLPRKGFTTGTLIMRSNQSAHASSSGFEGVIVHVAANGADTASIEESSYGGVFHNTQNTYLSNKILDNRGRVSNVEFDSDGGTVTASWYADGGNYNEQIWYSLHVN